MYMQMILHKYIHRKAGEKELKPMAKLNLLGIPFLAPGLVSIRNCGSRDRVSP